MSETKTDNYKIGILIDSIEDFDTAQKKNYNRFYFEKYDILEDIIEKQDSKNDIFKGFHIYLELKSEEPSKKIIDIAKSFFCGYKTQLKIDKINFYFINNFCFVPISQDYIIFTENNPFYSGLENQINEQKIYLRTNDELEFNYENLYKNNKLNEIAEKKKKTKEEILIKFNLKLNNLIFYKSNTINLKNLNEFNFDFDLDEEEMEQINLLTFYHLCYISCNCNNCPFPIYIKFINNQIHTSCIKNHVSQYNSFRELLLNKNNYYTKIICSTCNKKLSNEEKWYCHICDYYYHNNNKCGEQHIHPLLYYNNIFNYCPFHLKKIIKFCDKCEKGICINCFHNHEEKYIHSFQYLSSFEKNIINFIYNSGLNCFDDEKYFLEQYYILEKKKIFNFEIIQNVKNIINNYPKVLGNYYFGSSYNNQINIFKNNFLSNKDYIFFLIVNNNNFFSYDIKGQLKLFEFYKNKEDNNEYNFKEKIIIDEKFLKHQNSGISIIEILKIIFEKINNIKITNYGFQIFYLEDIIIQEQKIIKKTEIYCLNIEKREDKLIIKKEKVYNSNNEEIILPENSKFLSLNFDKDNLDLNTILYYHQNDKSLILKNLYNENVIFSVKTDLDIYKIFHYNTFDKELFFLITFNLNIFYCIYYDEKNQNIEFKMFNSNKDVLEKNDNIQDCFISGSQIVLFSKNKQKYLPLNNVSYE